MTSDANLQIRNYFESLCQTAKRLDQCQAGLMIERLNLSELDIGLQIIKLRKELDLLLQEMVNFKRKEYLIYADDEHALYNIFSARLLFYHSQEEDQLTEGIILNERKKRLNQFLDETIAQLPLFTLSDFMNNKENVVFYELNQQPWGTSQEEYAAMRYWQTQMKAECVDQFTNHLIARFIENVMDIPGNRDLAQAEKYQLEFILGNAHQIATKQFILLFSKLRALSAHSMPENEAQWHESFCQFMNGKPMPHAFSPGSLQSAYRDIQAGRISNVPICCWSLIRFQKWLSDFLEGKIDLKELPELSYEKLFEKTLAEGLTEGEKIIPEFSERYASGEIPEDKYTAVIFKELNKLSAQFNQLLFPDYYRFLSEINTLKNYFINNCFLNKDIEVHCNELRKTIVLDEKIKFLENELIQINPKLIRTSFDLQLLNHHINDIISIMIPDNDLMGQLKQALTQASRWVEGRKPILFIEMDLTDSFSSIFLQAATHLQQIFDFQPANLKVIYAVCQIRDLDYLEITAQRDGQALNKWIADLKKIFQSELQYKEYQHRCDPIEYLIKENENTELKPHNNKPLVFNYKNIRDDKLSLVLHALIKLKAIPPNTTLPQFRALFNGREVIHPIEWLAAQGDLMVFIREMVRINDQNFTIYKQHWKIAVQCFVQKGGKGLFDPQKLRNSKPTLLEQKFKEAARKFK